MDKNRVISGLLSAIVLFLAWRAICEIFKTIVRWTFALPVIVAFVFADEYYERISLRLLGHLCALVAILLTLKLYHILCRKKIPYLLCLPRLNPTRKLKVVAEFAIGASIGFIMAIIDVLILYPVDVSQLIISGEYRINPFPKEATGLFIWIIGIDLIATLTEEIAWRGGVLNCFLTGSIGSKGDRRRSGEIPEVNIYKNKIARWPIWLSAFLFGFWHLIPGNHDIWRVMHLSLVLGPMLAMLYLISERRIWMPWGCHLLWNLVCLVMTGSPKEGYEGVITSDSIPGYNYLFALLLGVFYYHCAMRYLVFKSKLLQRQVATPALLG